MNDQWTFASNCIYFAVMDKTIFRQVVDRFVKIGNYTTEESVLSLDTSPRESVSYNRIHKPGCRCFYCFCQARERKYGERL